MASPCASPTGGSLAPPSPASSPPPRLAGARRGPRCACRSRGRSCWSTPTASACRPRATAPWCRPAPSTCRARRIGSLAAVSELRAHEAVNQYFAEAARVLELDDELSAILTTSYREIAVQVPVRLD